MTNLEINKKINQIVFDFESSQITTNLNNWDAKLNNKLLSNQVIKSNYSSKYKLILVSLLLLNISYITYSLIKVYDKKENISSDLKLISSEILITSNN